MNSDKQAPSRQRGNVMIYILIALGLIGALTVAITRQGDQSSGENLSAEQVTLQATQLLAYASAAQLVIDQMTGTGTDLNEYDYAIPSDTSFNTAPYIHKVFHPRGGGLGYKPAVIPPFFDTSSPEEGWYIKNVNVEWSPTGSSETVISAYSLEQSICEALNKKITGSTTIPTIVSSSLRNIFTTYTMTTGSLTAAICPGCANHNQLCIGGSGERYTFYTILEMR